MRILIADDEPNIVISLEFLLEREGYRGGRRQRRRGGAPAVASLRARPDAARHHAAEEGRLRGVPAHPRQPGMAGIRVVMLTAKGRETEVSKGLALGADAYVTKPFSTKDLVAQVRKLLGLGG